jgi:Cof subfamily protein (haloacid dehalogenase superfamily)
VLYLSDLDKTLLRTDLSVGELTRSVWNEAVARGEHLSIATARSHTGIRQLLAGLDLREPMILLDGALIAKPDGTILHAATLDAVLGAEVLSIAHRLTGEWPLIVALEADGGERFYYPPEPNRWQRELLATMQNARRRFTTQPPVAQEQNLKLVYQQDEPTTAAIEAALRDALGDAVEIKRAADPYIDCWFLTVLHPEGDKAHALTRLEALEGIDRNKTTVFGDHHNDIGLFRAAGTKVAVANAVPELKALADIVLPHTNDEEGVARYLRDAIRGAA